MKTLSLVIPFYNRVSHLKNILSSLSRQAVIHEIILPIFVVDSYSVDNLTSIISSSYINLDISILQTSNNLSKKRNVGGLASSSDYIAFLDDDCLPSSDYLASILGLINDATVQSFVFSGLVSFPSDLVSSSHYIKFRQDLLDLYPRTRLTECKEQNAYAMNFLISRSLFTDTLFSESINSYGWEDQEFFHRLSFHGHTILNSDFAILHLESSTFYQSPQFST